MVTGMPRSLSITVAFDFTTDLFYIFKQLKYIFVWVVFTTTSIISSGGFAAVGNRLNCLPPETGSDHFHLLIFLLLIFLPPLKKYLDMRV